MKKIISICIGFILFLWVVMFLSSCTPVRYVYIHPKDSVVVKQRVVYDNIYVPQINYFGNWIRPYYNPIIIRVPQRQSRYSNRVAPQRPSIPNRPLPKRAPRERN
jgi:hypothetical protein